LDYINGSAEKSTQEFVMTNEHEIMLSVEIGIFLILTALALIFGLILWGVRLGFGYRAKEGAWQLKSQELQNNYDGLLRQYETALRAQQETTNVLQIERDAHLQTQLNFAQLKARTDERETQWQAQLALLSNAKEILHKEFENTANRIFETKQEQFSRATQGQLEALISPFRDQLREFRGRVDEVQRQDVAQQHQLMGQITELQKQSHQIGLDAVKLANALKGNNKLVGNWGEMILSRILEQMGLQKGREYETQVSVRDEDGKRLQPDVVVYLPNNRELVIDAKASLVAYERYVNAESDGERDAALKEHVDSLRAHIRNLSQKNYASTTQKGSSDFVCLFVPIETAFVVAIQNAPDILQEAYDRKIMLVCPSSLFVVLRLAIELWQRDRQDRNVEQIVEDAGRLYDQFVRFVEALQDIGNYLDKAKKSYDTALDRLAEGKGNLIRRSENLRKLGAKTSKNLPKSLVDNLGQDAQEEMELNTGDDE
jgi:DNA recombination protein RmuC